MSVETVGNPPPEADQLRADIEKQLPNIIARFSQVLQEEYGFTGLRVGGFTVVPEQAATGNISCDQETCSTN
ncbi:hypothetical protein XM38_000880 [Halomicronema hongdechloris C2206]|uniref:Uncharacterized protein n=1 Tax=Halomicronema hongdechloris C2206 TaxID=1641165 RepID=A0A1Z3HFV2_9CYAN|nr:hypothetical protein [Halomicronema hongdechloris]ASC69162.1 hypothetical protein XM38_000880 [Halomicronema hongdechloris C2206]